MKKNVFSFYIVLTVIGLTSIFLFPARGRSECDRRDLSGICMDNPNVVIHYQEGSSVAAAENAAAGQPILISPWGETFTTTPTYTWYAVADATWYHLWVNHSTGTLGEKWYTAEEVGCPAGTGNCSLSPGTVLAPGTYTWWIQAWYNAYGPWSNGKPFYVDPNGKNCQNISSVGFTPVTSGMTYAASWGEKWRTGGTNYYFEAPVHLPAGAQITNVFLDYYDGNATQDLWLWLYDLVPGGSGSGYGTFSSGTPGYGRLELNFIYDYNLIVNNAGHSYFVSVGLMATDASNKFHGAIICYKPIP